MTERELRALQSLTNELRSIHEEIHAHNKQRKADSDSAKNDPIRPLPIEVTWTPSLDPTRSEYYKAENEDRKSPLRALKPWVETIGVLTALVLVCLNISTLNEIQKQTPKIAESADAAKESADASLTSAIAGIQQTRSSEESNWLSRANSISSGRQSKAALDSSIASSRIDQRAWMSIGAIPNNPPIFQVGKVFVPNFALVNTGRTPAINAMLKFRVDSLAPGHAPDFAKLKEVLPVVETYGPGFSSRFEVNNSSLVVSQSAYDSVTRGDQVIFMYGGLNYRDAFGFNHWLKFSYRYQPANNEFSPEYSQIDQELR